MHLGAEFESAAELGHEITVSVAKHALSNLIEIVQKYWLQTHSRKLLCQQLALDSLIFVFADLVWVLEVDLLDQLSDQIFVEVGAEFVRKLQIN